MNRLLISTVLLIQCHITFANVDFCDADPWVRTALQNCPGSAGNVFITLERLNMNPYHALHETVWALSHYILHCTKSPRTDVTIALAERRAHMNFSKCLDPLASTVEGAPRWAACVLYVMFLQAGVPSTNIISTQHKIEKCYTKTVLLSQTPLDDATTNGTRISRSLFARTEWYGRDCARSRTGIGNAASMCDMSNIFGSGLVPLPERFKIGAFEGLRVAGVSLLEQRARLTGDAVRVVVYDRRDTNRRIWVNSEAVVRNLEEYRDVQVVHIHSIPSSFIEQVKLFNWADILIAPHGAATANSIFMLPFTDIIEIWGSCNSEVSETRYVPRSWTGWHAHLLELNVQYAQCHMKTNGDDPDGPHVVRAEEVVDLFENALRRQRFRLSKEEENAVGFEKVKEVLETRTEFPLSRAFAIALAGLAVGVWLTKKGRKRKSGIGGGGVAYFDRSKKGSRTSCEPGSP